MISAPYSIRSKNLFFKCLIASTCLHVGCAYYFYTHPFLLKSSWQSLFHLSSAQPQKLFQEEDETETSAYLLKDVFDKLIVASSHFSKPLDSITTLEGQNIAPQKETGAYLPDVETEGVSSLVGNAPSFQTEVTLPAFVETHEEVSFSAHLPKREITDPFASLSREENSLVVTLNPEAQVPLEEKNVNWPASVPHGPLQVTPSSPISFEDKTATLSFKLDTKPTLETPSPSLAAEAKGEIAETSLPPLALARSTPLKATALLEVEDYELPDLAVAEDWKKFFHVDLQFTPDKEGNGYLFSIDITPKKEIKAQTLKQNFYFILDRSYGIQKHKFGVFKRAVLKAISSMKAGESFNIYFLDRKGVKFSDKPVPYSMDAAVTAEQFLEQQEVGTPFVSSHLYSALEHVLAEIPEEGIHTAIILTDGKTSLKPAEEQKALKQWLRTNQGKLSVYTAAVGQKNNLVSLDLLSSASGGKLLYSDTHASFPRKLAKLVLDLHDPIVCDISLAAIPADENASVILSQTSSHLPALHSHKTYRIVGKIDHPCDFDLVLKGRGQKEWITVEEKLSFADGDHLAESGSSKDLFQMHLLYAKFLREGGISPLKDAKEILKKSHDAIAFE